MSVGGVIVDVVGVRVGYTPEWLKLLAAALVAAYQQGQEEAAALIVEAKRGRFAPHTTNWDDCLDEVVDALRVR